jgi:nucleotide-binding universal stress UspA family protein
LVADGDETKGDGLFKRIVVGTDGSDTATEAVRQAIELAKMSGAKLDLVAAFEPVPQTRLREEGGEVPGDVQYAVGPREDVNVTLDSAVGKAKQEGV